MAARFQQILNAKFRDHYARTEQNVDPRRMSPRELRHMDRTYGPFLGGLDQGARILDLGCGTGRLVRWMLNRSLVTPVGVDSSLSQIELAREAIPQATFHCENGLDLLKRHPQQFDGIYCLGVLTHIRGDDLLFEWMEACYEALKPGGFFCGASPNGVNLTATAAWLGDLAQVRVFTDSSFRQLLETANFRDCKCFPVSAGSTVGSCRQFLEWCLHRAVFGICGRFNERIFTSKICIVGYR
jgi:2-polyprenyl-3-methyl-5-hydroxy-6-metoxy-1,4-benzoquinol methylase